MASTVCTVCGSETVVQARFCHHCGASIDGVPVDVDLFPPSAASAEPVAANPMDRRRLGLGLAVAAVAIVGLIVLLRDTESSPADPPASAEEPDSGVAADSTSSPQIETASSPPGEPVAADALGWTPGASIGGPPVAFVEVGDSTMLFVAPGISPLGFHDDGLEAWRRDGDEWTSLGEVIAPPARVTAITSAPDGVVAVGTRAGGTPSAWRSHDGVEWTADQLPTDASSGAPPEPDHVAVVGDHTIVIAGSPWNSALQVLSDAVDEHLGADLREYGYSLTDPPGGVRVFGPLGMTMAEVTYADLGLSPPESDALEAARSGQPVDSTVWAATRSGEWAVTTLPELLVHDVAVLDGEVRVFGHGPAGQTTVASNDGITWTEGRDERLVRPVRWRDSLVGIRPTHPLAVAFHPPDADSATILLGNMLPEGSNRYLLGIDAGAGGVAATLQVTDDPATPSGRTTVATDGFTITRDWSAPSQIVVRDDRGERLRVAAYEPDPSTYVADIAAEAVTYLDPDDGSPLVTLSLEQLRVLQTPPTPDRGPGQVLAVSTDLATWSINWLSGLTPDPGYYSATHLDDEQVTVVIGTLSSTTAWATEEPAYRLFTASLPAG